MTDNIIKEYKDIPVKLDGKQSLTIPINLKKNGRLITEVVDIIVRGEGEETIIDYDTADPADKTKVDDFVTLVGTLTTI